MAERGKVQLDTGDLVSKRYALRGAFSPAAPINKAELFAGRAQQRQDISDVILQPGQHAIVYGEQGVGKTSLISVLADFLSSQDIRILALRANCDATDSFSRIWRKALDRAQIKEESETAGFVPQLREVTMSASDALPSKKVTPDDVRRALQIIGSISSNTVVFLDEFDRLRDIRTRNRFADTIKTLSDHHVPVTLVLAGVADNIDELLTQHQSIERALVQIRMPPMSDEELKDIVTKGLQEVGMTIQPAALSRIATLSQGLPHYAHVLGQLAADIALRRLRNEVEGEDVAGAIERAIQKAEKSVTETYYRATTTGGRNSIYTQVLLACSLAEKGPSGYFLAANVKDPLSAITGKGYEIRAFTRHLNRLCERERGPVLQRRIVGTRSFYRFINPLLQPYISMKGLAEGLIGPGLVGTP